MSGLKTISVKAGLNTEQSSENSNAVAKLASFGSQIIQEYKDRIEREKNLIAQREREIQLRIAEFKVKSYSYMSQRKSNQASDVVASKHLGDSDNLKLNYTEQDLKAKVKKGKEAFQKIQQECQELIALGILTLAEIEESVRNAENALANSQIQDLYNYISILDNTRISAIKDWKSTWQIHIDYLEERLEGLFQQVPPVKIQEIRIKIDSIFKSTDSYEQKIEQIEEIHQKITILEIKANQIVEATNNMIESWTQVGYCAKFIGFDDGDAIIEVETHEGSNTQIRIQYESQQIDLFGPPEETPSCTARTKEALQIFQQQGYYLEWEKLDGQVVPEEWKTFFSASPEHGSQYNANTPRKTIKH